MKISNTFYCLLAGNINGNVGIRATNLAQAFEKTNNGHGKGSTLIAQMRYIDNP